MTKTLAAMAIAAPITGGALVGASPAQAGRQCFPEQGKTGYTVACLRTNPGSYQAWANSRNDFWPWDYKHVVGPWMSGGKASQARCPNARWTVQAGGTSFR